jgi:hypothetical protein
LQIDNFEAAQAVSNRLEKTLPFQARLGKELLKMMKDRGKTVDANTTFTVDLVKYSGDVGGINCGFESISGMSPKERFVVSITHLIIDPQHPLASELTSYQQNRILGLMLQDRVGFAAELLGQRTSPKRKKRGSGFGK